MKISTIGVQAKKKGKGPPLTVTYFKQIPYGGGYTSDIKTIQGWVNYPMKSDLMYEPEADIHKEVQILWTDQNGKPHRYYTVHEDPDAQEALEKGQIYLGQCYPWFNG